MRNNLRYTISLILLCAFIISFSTFQVSAAEEHIHLFVPSPLSTLTHPHKTVSECECGATQTTYPLHATCSTCRANEMIATNTVRSTKVFVYLDGDAGFGIPVTAPIDCVVTYTNYYDYPFSMMYNYPPFASFLSIVESYTDVPAIYPSVNCWSGTSVKYYSSGGTLLFDQAMQQNQNFDAIPSMLNHVYTLNSRPSYTTSSAMFFMPTSGMSYTIDVTTYFS